MATRAAWRVLPDDPRTPLGWLGRDARRWAAILHRRAMLAVVLLALYALFGDVFPAFFAAVLALTALFWLAPPRPHGPVVPDPSPGATFRGRIEVRRNGALLGWDEALVTFVEGWIHVEGNRSTFALSNVELGHPRPGAMTQLLLGMEEGMRQMRSYGVSYADLDALRQVDLADGTSIRFHRAKPLAPGSVFERHLADWKGGVAALGESTLPPDRPLPLARVQIATDLVAALLGLIVATLALAFHPLAGLLALVLLPGPTIFRAMGEFVRLKRTAFPR